MMNLKFAAGEIQSIYINSRIKTPASILEKMHRRGYPVTMESLRENMHDIAGVRVICAYGSDIYSIAEMLMKQDDVMVLMVRITLKSKGERLPQPASGD